MLHARQLWQKSAQAALRLHPRALRVFAGPPRHSDGNQLDLQTQVMLRCLELGRVPPFDQLGVRRARRWMDSMAPLLDYPPDPDVRWHDRLLNGLRLRLYRPGRDSEPQPGVLYFHGGGFMLGSLQSHHGWCSRLAAQTRCTVIAVDYRLAPEYRFPAAVDDAAAAFRSVVAHADELGIRADRVAIAGDSAGGNLSTVVSLLTREERVRPALQVLIYPALDLTCSFPSHTRFATGYFLTSSMIRWFLAHYLRAPQDARDVRASPWFADDLRRLPPALVLGAGFDPLHDEVAAWAKRLQQADNQVQLLCCDGLIHGFATMGAGIRAAGEVLDRAAAAIARALHG